MQIMEKVLNGQTNWRFLTAMIPYEEGMISIVESAVLEGVLPQEALRTGNE